MSGEKLQLVPMTSPPIQAGLIEAKDGFRGVIGLGLETEKAGIALSKKLGLLLIVSDCTGVRNGINGSN